MSEISSRICPTNNLCDFAAGPGNPACGIENSHLSSLEFAEWQCPRALAGYLASLGDAANAEGNQTKYSFQRVSAMIDLAVHPSTPRDSSANLFETARGTCRDILADSNSGGSVHADTRILLEHLPIFAARRTDSDTSYDELAEYQARADAAMFKLLEDIAQSRHADSPSAEGILPLLSFSPGAREGILGKVGIYLLARRRGIALQPTTYREHTMRGTNNTPYHHTWYGITNAGNKVPVRVRVSSSKKIDADDTRIGVVSYAGLYNRVMNQLVGTKSHSARTGRMPASEALTTVEWLLDERRNPGQQTEKQIKVLDRMAEVLDIHIQVYAKQLTGEGESAVVPASFPQES